MKNITKMLLIYTIVVLVLMPVFVFGQIPAIRPDPGVKGLTLNDISALLIKIGNWLIIAAMIVAVIVIVWGGIQYMFSSDKTDAAKSRIYNGIIGAAVVLGVGLILRTLALMINQQFFG